MQRIGQGEGAGIDSASHRGEGDRWRVRVVIQRVEVGTQPGRPRRYATHGYVQGHGCDRCHLDAGLPGGLTGQSQAFITGRNRFTAEASWLKQAEPVADAGTTGQHLITVRPPERGQLEGGATVTLLEEVGPRRERRQRPLAGDVHGVEDRHIQAHRRRERVHRGNLGQRQRQMERARRQRTQRQGRRDQGRVKRLDGGPIGTSGGLVGKGRIAARTPACAGLILPGGGVAIAHQSRARGDRRNLAVLQPNVVIFEEEEIVTKLMDEGARPILAEVAGGGAKAVPDRTHADLARIVQHRLRDRVSDFLADHAADHRGGPYPVGGVDPNVGAIPILAVVEDGDVAEGGLAVAGLEEQFRGAGEIRLELGHKTGVVAGVPLQGDAQVEEGQGVIQRDGDGLHARCGHRRAADAIGGGQNIRGVETHGLRVGVGVGTGQ